MNPYEERLLNIKKLAVMAALSRIDCTLALSQAEESLIQDRALAEEEIVNWAGGEKETGSNADTRRRYLDARLLNNSSYIRALQHRDQAKRDFMVSVSTGDALHHESKTLWAAMVLPKD